jgi:hypothetical protein
MNKKKIILGCFNIALTLYFVFFIWRVWVESPENHGIIGILEEWYMKSIGKIVFLILLVFAIGDGVVCGVSFIGNHIRKK